MMEAANQVTTWQIFVPSDGLDRESTFTIEQEWKYACSYEKGFDLPDPQDDAWLGSTILTI